MDTKWENELIELICDYLECYFEKYRFAPEGPFFKYHWGTSKGGCNLQPIIVIIPGHLPYEIKNDKIITGLDIDIIGIKHTRTLLFKKETEMTILIDILKTKRELKLKYLLDK